MNRGKNRNAAAVNRLPVVEFHNVYHVGTLAGRGAQSASSLEGPCLSVSINPRAWIRIARLGGLPWWTIENTGGKPLRFVDIHAIPKGTWRALVQEAVSRKLLSPVTLYRSWMFCDEEIDGDGWRYSLHETIKEAEREADDPGKGPRGKGVEKTRGYSASPGLSAWWFSGVKNPEDRQISHALCEDAAVLFLIESQKEHDGVWWNERLDPLSYSAPRGAVFPEVLAGLKTTEVPPAEKGEE